MMLRARWTGSPPQQDEYLMSQGRARFAYRIVEVELRGEHATGSIYRMEVEKIAASDVPAGATVHPWKWDPRHKTGAAWSART